MDWFVVLVWAGTLTLAGRTLTEQGLIKSGFTFCCFGFIRKRKVYRFMLHM